MKMGEQVKGGGQVLLHAAAGQHLLGGRSVHPPQIQSVGIC